MNVMGGTILDIMNSISVKVKLEGIELDYSQDDYYNLSNNFNDFRLLCSTCVNLTMLRLTIIDPLKPDLLNLLIDGLLPNLKHLKLKFDSVVSRGTYLPMFTLI